MASAYADFIATKERAHSSAGIQPLAVSDPLFPFQKAVVKWCLKKGSAALFAGTGTGKTPMQCEYVHRMDEGRRLIVAPLGVLGQTVAMARNLLNVEVIPVRTRDDIGSKGIYIVNYDRLHMLEGIEFTAVALDESSIIKSHDGAYRKYIQDRFAKTPYKLPCTATPAPNDYMELATHAELVGAMSRLEMLATFFTHDGGDTSKWRLKRHAVGDFWRWVSTWACVFTHPRDLGFDQGGFDLPELEIHERRVFAESTVGGGLFSDGPVSASQVFSVLRDTAEARADVCGELVRQFPDDPWLIWCNTDKEQDCLERAIEGASVRGSDSLETKEDRLLGFAEGRYQRLITKPKIGGYGMNWQCCNRMIFCGVTYSFEQVYQAIRRCWRFGQTKPVHVYFVTCNAQESVMSALQVKEQAFSDMAREMARHCKQEVL